MDAFRTLTGGSRFDKKRFQGDMNHFQKQEPIASTSTAVAAALPSELDFFAASPSSSSTKASTATPSQAQAKKDRKRKRAQETTESNEPAEATASVETTHDYPALLRKHKIKLTGLDLPEPVASIEDLVARTRRRCSDEGGAGQEGGAVEAVERLARNWRELGYKDPTGVQMAAWGTMLAGRDILACAPTGSGKTYSFILPLLALLPPSSRPPPPPSASSAQEDKVLRPRAVVIEPTRELSIQVLREARKLAFGVGAGAATGEDGKEWKIAVLGEEGVGLQVAKGKKGKKAKKAAAAAAAQAKKIDGATDDAAAAGSDDEEHATGEGSAEVPAEDGAQQPYYGPVDILITTPLRLVFALKSNLVSLSTTLHLILDEADKLFELNFLEQTDEILAACGTAAGAGEGGGGEVRKGMFSATMPSTVEELAKGVMAGAGAGMVRAIVGHKEAATTTIDQSLLFVNREDHKLLSLRSLITSGQFTPPVLIFVQSIQRAKELANELVFDGINADAIHADRSAAERDEVVRRFAEGKVWCLICTDVMARGVDFKGVKLVINYDFPQSAMSYIHRIGRTGRAGKAGKAVTFFSKADAGHLKTIVNVMRASGCSVPEWMVSLPNPSQNSKKQLKQRPIGRKDISRTLGAGAMDDEEEGARKGRQNGKKGAGGGGGGHQHGKKRVMSGVGSGFAGAGSKARKEGGGGKKDRPTKGDKGAQARDGAAAAGADRPAKKAKREVALDE
ncbi:hypothetical protein JCM10908_006825 [Rhodotorula pacifica]|uniref:uncharacterized protein n=1 Tax=Rhodotorula pacifica TaxID=1495444 RepID=UPI00316CF107